MVPVVPIYEFWVKKVMNLARVITAVILGFITSFFLMVGGSVFSLSIAIVAIFALWEFYNLVMGSISYFERKIIYVLGFITSTLLILSVDYFGGKYIFHLFFLNIIISAVFSVLVFKSYPSILNVVMNQVFGLVYISLFLSSLVLIRKFFDGFAWSLMVVCIVAAGDIGAYYFGGLLGKYKLAPNISPNKTVEGLIAGLICSLIVAFIFKFYFFSFLSIEYCAVFAFLVGIVAHIGDLFSSGFKRMAGAKDSGKVLPGHGGILDRIDGFLFALPTAYFLLKLIK